MQLELHCILYLTILFILSFFLFRIFFLLFWPLHDQYVDIYSYFILFIEQFRSTYFVFYFIGLVQTVHIAVKGMFQENPMVLVHNQWAVLFLNRDVFIQSEAHILFVIGLLQKP